MLEEGKRQSARPSDPAHAATNRRVQFDEVLGATVSQFLPFDVPPHGLNGIQVGRIAWQSLHGEPTALAQEVLLHDAALVGG